MNVYVCNAERDNNLITVYQKINTLNQWLPITVAARSTARIVFARWNTGIVGSNPTQGMDVCVVLCR
jgi:hypothetical protein